MLTWRKRGKKREEKRTVSLDIRTEKFCERDVWAMY
jgi:hypothetical protein